MRVRDTCILLATWGLTCTALAQTQSPPAQNPGAAQPAPQSSGPAAASSPHQRNVTGRGTPEAATNENANPTGASSPHQRDSTRLAEAGRAGRVSSGMMVDDRSGQTLGTVADVVPAKSAHRYVVVNGSDGRTTPVPYDVASSMMAAGKIVLDRTAFEQAPKISQSELSRGSSASWRKKVDRYWRKHPG
ncbi:MAG TPA: hypothetical protein VN730_01835 [Steroidobacteraceae bacterium]|nr:hypothetical protein [Steroidobacteraceae bacterium]